MRQKYCFRVPLVMISVMKTICFVLGKSKYAKKVRMCCERKTTARVDWFGQKSHHTGGEHAGSQVSIAPGTERIGQTCMNATQLKCGMTALDRQLHRTVRQRSMASQVPYRTLKQRPPQAYLVGQRLENIHLCVDLHLLRLADTIHVDLAPSHFDAFLLIVALEDCLERTVAELLIELSGQRSRTHDGGRIALSALLQPADDHLKGRQCEQRARLGANACVHALQHRDSPSAAQLPLSLTGSCKRGSDAQWRTRL